MFGVEPHLQLERIDLVVEVLDSSSRVYRVAPDNQPSISKVLHRSNLHPWSGSERNESRENEGREEEAEIILNKEEEETEKMLDMEEVLARFGVITMDQADESECGDE